MPELPNLRSVDINENLVSVTGQQLLQDCLAALNNSRDLSSKLQVFALQQYPEQDAPLDFYTPAMVLGGPALSKDSPDFERPRKPGVQPKRPRGGAMPDKGLVRYEWATVQTAHKVTSRENLQIARQRFFDDYAISSPAKEGQDVGEQNKRRSMIGGGPEERMRSIERSQARRSFYATSHGTLVQETKL